MRLLQIAPTLVTVVVVLGAAAFVAAHVLDAGSGPTGPVDIVWDREICAHCRMHIGERGFAAQIQTEDGRVLCFDDPGCAFRMLDSTPLSVRAIYFHHHREARWIPADQTAFVAVSQSPMGFGLAATDVADEAAIPLAEARRRALAEEGR